MTNQTASGKAFEYALVVAIYNIINNGQKIKIHKDNSYKMVKDHFESHLNNEQEKYNKAANSAMRHIVTLEPRLKNALKDEQIAISIQSDQKGEYGDIRDEC